MNQLIRVIRQNFEQLERQFQTVNPVLFNTTYADTLGVYDIDMTTSVYFISSFGGAVTATLPNAADKLAIGRQVTIKKTDSSGNAVTVVEDGGAGPDQSSQVLATQYEAITVLSDGNQWFILNKY